MSPNKYSPQEASLFAQIGALIRLAAIVFTFLFWLCISLLVLFLALFFPCLPLFLYIQKSVLALSGIGISFVVLVYFSFRLGERLVCSFINSYVETHIIDKN